jgi:predicted ATPase
MSNEYTQYTPEELEQKFLELALKKAEPEKTPEEKAYWAKVHAAQSLTQELKAISFLQRPRRKSAQVMPLDEAKKLVYQIACTMLEQQGKGVKAWIVEPINAPKILQVVKWFISDPSCEYDLNKGLYVFGDVGKGKTFLLSVMSAFAECAGIESRKFAIKSAADIADTVLFGEDRISRDTEMSKYGGGHLCFDDLGQEQAGKRFGNDIDVMERILSKRYDRMTRGYLITHATSNITPKFLEERYGSRISDRANEMFNFVLLQGESKRKK